MEQYEEAYKLCKNQIVAATDILITPSGNARCGEIMDHWLSSGLMYSIPCKGVIVMCDESFKEIELGTWNAVIVASTKTKGVFLFGDEKQLAPINTASRGQLEYGQFNALLDVALPHRLVKESFPFIFLKEQRRMVSSLPSVPSSAMLTIIAPMLVQIPERRVLPRRTARRP